MKLRTLAFLIAASTAAHAQDASSGMELSGQPIMSVELPAQPDNNGETTDANASNATNPDQRQGRDHAATSDRNTGGQTSGTSKMPLIGAKRLLHSLSELDRPLTPEEITAYGAAVQSVLPMSPKLIRDYRRRIDESQKAAALPPSGKRARPISDSVRISLSARQRPLMLDTTPNTVSVMSFYDRTGKAWPIASYVVGRADAFQVYALQKGSNQIAVTPLVNHGYSNLVISLVEEDRPLVVNLETNEKKTDFRRDVTINAYGPNADLSPTTVTPATPPSDKTMMAFAQGAGLPKSAQQLNTSDPGIEAWSYKGDMYIRTTDTLMSPAWSAALTGPGAVHAYRLKRTPVALVSRDGQISRVSIAQ